LQFYPKFVAFFKPMQAVAINSNLLKSLKEYKKVFLRSKNTVSVPKVYILQKFTKRSWWRKWPQNTLLFNTYINFFLCAKLCRIAD